jgi:hypothetical protein
MTNYFKECIKTLQELHKDYPNFSIGRHLATAMADYGDTWGMSDKEMSYALQKYQAELQIDPAQVVNDEYVDQIMKDGMNLTDTLEEEDY